MVSPPPPKKTHWKECFLDLWIILTGISQAEWKGAKIRKEMVSKITESVQSSLDIANCHFHLIRAKKYTNQNKDKDISLNC